MPHRAGIHEAAIINPAKSKRAPQLGPLAVMVSSQRDLNTVGRRLRLDMTGGRAMLMSRIHLLPHDSGSIALAGPVLGAPYAAIVLENLIAWGARQILFWGWCGSIDPAVTIGDLLLPDFALADEGTSKHYRHSGSARPEDRAQLPTQRVPRTAPSPELVNRVQTVLQRQHLAFQRQGVWTTDAVFRETPSKVAFFRAQGAVAVEMETSALFSVGAFRAVQVAALLVVSDELASGQWQPGFRDERFSQGRHAACEVITQLCQNA